VWLGWVLWRALDLDRFCSEHLIAGREQVAWSAMAAILVIARLIEPSSELHIAEAWYRRTALDDLLGVPAERVNDDRLYRALDRLLPHKQALEAHLKERLGALFGLDYELLLYDVTSTYFESQAGTSARTACWPTSWCASSPTCCGRRWSNGRAAPGWATPPRTIL
jgi:hypothetical protein